MQVRSELLSKARIGQHRSCLSKCPCQLRQKVCSPYVRTMLEFRLNLIQNNSILRLLLNGLDHGFEQAIRLFVIEFSAFQNVLFNIFIICTHFTRNTEILIQIVINCIYFNYFKEQNKAIPKEPVIFNKFPSSLVAAGDAIELPKIGKTQIVSKNEGLKFRNLRKKLI